MANQIQFDVEKLHVFGERLKTLEERLNDTSRQLTEELEQLKKDWNTPAGRVFFENQTYQWKEQVQKYIGLIDTLKEMIDYSISEYSELETEVQTLNNE